MYELLEACGPVVLATSLPADAIAAAASEGRAMHIYIESVMGTQTVRLLQTRDVREIDLVFAVRLGSHDDIRHEPWDTRDDVLRTLGLLPVKGLRRRHRQPPVRETAPAVPSAPLVTAVTAIAQEAAAAEAERARAHLAGAPQLELRVDGERVLFVFDAMLLFSTISGSDGYEHHVYSGTAQLVAGRLTDVATRHRRRTHVTEHEYEWAEEKYDRSAILREVLRELASR